jgi:hypothetical protein
LAAKHSTHPADRGFIDVFKNQQTRMNGESAARLIAMTLDDAPGETTHWTGALIAKTAGVPVSSVQRIWRTHGLQPHRVRQFKLSNDPSFIDKLRDVVGLYVDPPAHAVVLRVTLLISSAFTNSTFRGCQASRTSPSIRPRLGFRYIQPIFGPDIPPKTEFFLR